MNDREYYEAVQVNNPGCPCTFCERMRREIADYEREQQAGASAPAQPQEVAVSEPVTATSETAADRMLVAAKAAPRKRINEILPAALIRRIQDTPGDTSLRGLIRQACNKAVPREVMAQGAEPIFDWLRTNWQPVVAPTVPCTVPMPTSAQLVTVPAAPVPTSFEVRCRAQINVSGTRSYARTDTVEGVVTVSLDEARGCADEDELRVLIDDKIRDEARDWRVRNYGDEDDGEREDDERSLDEDSFEQRDDAQIEAIMDAMASDEAATSEAQAAQMALGDAVSASVDDAVIEPIDQGDV